MRRFLAGLLVGGLTVYSFTSVANLNVFQIGPKTIQLIGMVSYMAGARAGMVMLSELNARITGNNTGTVRDDRSVCRELNKATSVVERGLGNELLANLQNEVIDERERVDLMTHVAISWDNARNASASHVLDVDCGLQ